MRRLILFISALVAFCIAHAQNIQNNPGSNHGNKFEQLGTILSSPNEYRTASGAPGPKYWQQKCDYDIKCALDETNLKLSGSEKITYYNKSPDVLTYLWLQLDENQHSSVNNADYQDSSVMSPNTNITMLQAMEERRTDNGYGDKITKLTATTGKTLKYTINKTMMRVEIPTPLKPGEQFIFNVEWNYKISDRFTKDGRGGYEYFPEDGNYLFTITQWYPRLCVYSDFQGWQNHQFAGAGEFALTFGDFKVQITVPADHVVGATGECQNYQQVLDATHYARWQQAQNAKAPAQIFTLDEAKTAEKQKSLPTGQAGKVTKTWIFKAENVRDFAFTSSRKFIWDAMPAYVEDKKIMCMSYYGKEAYGLYSKYSTKLIAHTIKTYSHFTFPYPYPVAQSVEAANGMEYPMICFNNGRTNKDGTYSEATKNGMTGVIIHEVGHNFFPMIVNSDERQWTWMDEGLNSFLQYLTEELFDNKFPSRRGPAWAIVEYMKLPKNQLEPIMTNSENISQFGNNAYGKPTTALNILRETIMGRELFDYALKTYAQRWKFKHPTPADFFRTMEDASGEDLDWFWRGWFYGTDPCDISIDSVKAFKADFNGTPEPIMPPGKINVDGTKNLDTPIVNPYEDISKIRNREDKNIHFLTDVDTTLRDFYWRYDRKLEQYDSSFTFKVQPFETVPVDDTTKQKFANEFLYQVSFSNKGGLVMPIIVQWTFTDGTTEMDRIPAQIWRKNEQHVNKVFMKVKEVASIQLDPLRETADIDVNNNNWPKAEVPGNFTIYKLKKAARGQSQGVNPMQKANQKPL